MQKLAHTYPGTCRPLCHPTPNISFIVTKIRLIKVSLSFLRGGSISTGIQKAFQSLNLYFNLILRYNKTFYQKMHFKRKNCRANYLSNGTLGTFLALIGADILQLLCRLFFLADFATLFYS